jgi:hypothetical protein
LERTCSGVVDALAPELEEIVTLPAGINQVACAVSAVVPHRIDWFAEAGDDTEYGVSHFRWSIYGIANHVISFAVGGTVTFKSVQRLLLRSENTALDIQDRQTRGRFLLIDARG